LLLLNYFIKISWYLFGQILIFGSLTLKSMSLTKDLTLLSDRINALSESQTLAMSKKCRELAAQGHQVINLSIGEPDFQTPQHIKDAAKKAIDEGFTFYTPVSGIAMNYARLLLINCAKKTI
jgi:hypothetical protein